MPVFLSYILRNHEHVFGIKNKQVGYWIYRLKGIGGSNDKDIFAKKYQIMKKMSVPGPVYDIKWMDNKLIIGSSDSRVFKYSINPEDLEKILMNKTYEETKEIEEGRFL